MPEVRLQKVLAGAGLCSRRKAEAVILAGRVTVNDEVVRMLGSKVDPAHDRVAVDGRALATEPKAYFLVHKPRGVVTDGVDPWHRPTARALVDSTIRLFSVGRLDLDSAGLVLFTNDGALAEVLTRADRPLQEIDHVRVTGRPDAADLRRLRRGLVAGARRHPALAADLLAADADGRHSWVRIVASSPDARQARTALDAIGHPVCHVVRVGYGPLALGDLPEGGARRLTADERQALRAAATGG